MNFAAGSLVKARGREWVVLPESDEQLLLLRPLGGTNEEITGIYLPLEEVGPAQFKLPDPEQWGDAHTGKLLRDAIRLGFRSSSGPFRSFGHIAVEPRPYQLVPLLMALRLDPVRLLIADDVGIGKTVEAGLIARELLDRHEVERLAVLCPPHLAEQWQLELKEKFHIDAELLLASTVSRLERNCPNDVSLFEQYPYLIISIDFIKADRRRDQFIRQCPELVIVDEAHTCAYSGEGRGSRHQRFQLVSALAAHKDRHMILLTATPHSGDEGAFRSLLSFLNEEFRELPPQLSGRENEPLRRRLAEHFIQRRRRDIQIYLDRETPFPERDDTDESYEPSTEYKRLIEKVMSYARERVRDKSGEKNRQRIRWWSALALLRSIASSPAAAVATLHNRARVADAETVEDADRIGSQAVLDLVDNEATEGIDVIPGSDIEDEADTQKQRGRLKALAKEAEALQGEKDTKLQKAVQLVKQMVQEGYRPIIFCRFIPTAEYVAKELRRKLPKQVEVASVTGQLPPAEREERVLQLAEHEQRVLVCTDCLSEGINLQGYFNAVLHYDLSWNPTRHEQREGRVDRFGQASSRIKVISFYGKNNIIDEIVLDVLLRKHRQIRSQLGISVPVPVDSEQVVNALFEEVLLQGSDYVETALQPGLIGFEQTVHSQREQLSRDWDHSARRESNVRTIFAQHSIKVEEVQRELEAVQASIGISDDVARFAANALHAYGAFVTERPGNILDVNFADVPLAVRDAMNLHMYLNERSSSLRLSFEQTGVPGTLYVNRTHPLIEGLANYVMDTALDSEVKDPVARRCGVIRTSQVQTRTTLLLTRFRFQIHTPSRQRKELQPLLAEDCRLFAFQGAPQSAVWLEDEQQIEALLGVQAEANIAPPQIKHFLRQVLDSYQEHLEPHLEQMARKYAEELREAHRRVRRSASLTIRNIKVEPQLPLDVLGVYVYLPVQK
ncbi:SNF2 domain-containing protein [Thermosporothrix hazakensis]|jgi:superfamily II DNA or RNA helicase|uniref:SNF2 domain-containing protein n=1 Tax=Thermosporothrix hazakensis TaxID=644383 RepID=A0A326TP14_THEHA|nr:helicase-related protein [Thermosporothrix hazakensis]PZW18226.1 SNF2 domain-containing protein [Thermosporothrix hazakensis]GCE49794.1 ATP-dependent helicase HepA [Thermosporothrix hazakensis]